MGMMMCLLALVADCLGQSEAAKLAQRTAPASTLSVIHRACRISTRDHDLSTPPHRLSSHPRQN
jgi:hypothetical protein